MLERIPSPVVFLILSILAIFAGAISRQPSIGIGLLVFELLDWALLRGLHATQRSFGPIRPPLFALAICRLGTTLILVWISANWAIWGVMLLVTGLAYYATWIEPYAIQVTNKEMVFPQWPKGQKSVQLLHLTDLHLERKGLLHKRLQALILELAPDLVCFTGDLLNLSYNEDPEAIKDARNVLGDWHAPFGVYAVTGSPLVDLENSAVQVLDDLPGITWLQDETITLTIRNQTLTLVGLTCTHNPTTDREKLKELLVGDQISPLLLLYHSPDLAPEAADEGIDLQLSGHTHGGQIRFPLFGALVTSSIYGKRFEMGSYSLDRSAGRPMMLYVSRGLGMEGGSAPRARLYCKPEIILWTLKGV